MPAIVERAGVPMERVTGLAARSSGPRRWSARHSPAALVALGRRRERAVRRRGALRVVGVVLAWATVGPGRRPDEPDAAVASCPYVVRRRAARGLGLPAARPGADGRSA